MGLSRATSSPTASAVRNIFDGHHFKPTQAEASAISLQRGMDNECIDFFDKVNDDHDYKPYLDAVKKGFLKESDIDVALTRLFTARMKLGMFDPPEMVPYTKIDEKLLDSPAHRALARKLANESMVLLKNDGVLPLKTSGMKIAVVGPLADQTKVLLGNYNGTPTHSVSVLEGLKAEFPGAQIKFVPGTQFLSKKASPVPAGVADHRWKAWRANQLRHERRVRWLLGIRGRRQRLASHGWIPASASQPARCRRRSLARNPSWSTRKQPSRPRRRATITSEFAGRISTRASLDGKVVAMAFMTNGVETKLGRVHLEARQALCVEGGVRLPQGSATARNLSGRRST